MGKKNPTGITVKCSEDYNEYHRMYYHLRIKPRKEKKLEETKNNMSHKGESL